MIRGVLFDLGHTLWDILPDDDGALDAAYRAVHAELLTRGSSPVRDPDTMKRAVAAALKADAAYFTDSTILEQPPTHTWVQNGLRSIGMDLDEELLREITVPLFASELSRLAVTSGTVESVRDLRSHGYALACVTNTLASQSTIERMLEAYGFAGLFDAVIVSAELGYRKPHPMLFERAVHALDLRTSDAIFVGDSPYHDIGGAKALGMRAVLTRQYARREWVVGVPNPDAVIYHVRELRSAIRRIETEA